MARLVDTDVIILIAAAIAGILYAVLDDEDASLGFAYVILFLAGPVLRDDLPRQRLGADPG
jgi:hypothetical protein